MCIVEVFLWQLATSNRSQISSRCPNFKQTTSSRSIRSIPGRSSAMTINYCIPGVHAHATHAANTHRHTCSQQLQHQYVPRALLSTARQPPEQRAHLCRLLLGRQTTPCHLLPPLTSQYPGKNPYGVDASTCSDDSHTHTHSLCAAAGPLHRSISPNTTSSVPITVTTSANMRRLHRKSVVCRWANPGERILHLHTAQGDTTSVTPATNV